ncbi:hypothetical protein PV726_46185 [Streptomyces europaeiscabiei]|uniref:DUF6896 domain-containing protein n=1 Tax=Streptomyces europaeiscabiei TaxID=146819 RepID=UPI0029A58404|nr:hypothetical protein [Streptomyces europaeiscabiei]MDX3697467.1 hypothetical protein [Streptomyces europaeiscabiei]
MRINIKRPLNAIDEAMRVVFPSLERLADVLGLVRSRRISRSGHIGTYSYTVHGAGCRFVSDNGTEVDVDFAADGSEVFDLWRLRWYGLSLPEPVGVTDQDLRSAVRSLQPQARMAVGAPLHPIFADAPDERN